MVEQEKIMTKIVRPLDRGQITIPIEFRQKLGIDANSLLNITLKGNRIEIVPVVVRENKNEEFREYTQKEITEFLREDKIDEETAKTVKKLLAEGRL